MKALPGSELMTIHLCQPLRIAVKEGCRSLHPGLGDNETDNRIMEIMASFRVLGLGSGYIGARNDTKQQSGQTPDKKVFEIKNITVYVSGYTGTGGDNIPVLSVST